MWRSELRQILCRRSVGDLFLTEILFVSPITLNHAKAHVADFLLVSADVSPWTEAEFLCDLPGKWDLSLAVWDKRPIAYAILSRKWPDRVHIHQFMVLQSYRGSGVGGELLTGIIERHRNERLSLKVDTENTGAIRFYTSYGFRTAESDGDYQWLFCN